MLASSSNEVSFGGIQVNSPLVLRSPEKCSEVGNGHQALGFLFPCAPPLSSQLDGSVKSFEQHRPFQCTEMLEELPLLEASSILGSDYLQGQTQTAPYRYTQPCWQPLKSARIMPWGQRQQISPVEPLLSRADISVFNHLCLKAGIDWAVGFFFFCKILKLDFYLYKFGYVIKVESDLCSFITAICRTN